MAFLFLNYPHFLNTANVNQEFNEVLLDLEVLLGLEKLEDL
jgi:hypothetical protein